MTLYRKVTVPEGTSPEEVAILNAASAGVEGSRELVRDLLARKPELLQLAGMRAADAEQSILAAGCSQNALIEETARAEMESMRAALTLPGDGPLERLLVERLVLCWAGVTTADVCRADLFSVGATHATLAFHDGHVSRLNADFLKSARSLAAVRRLLTPGVQVNLAAQFNMGGG